MSEIIAATSHPEFKVIFVFALVGLAASFVLMQLSSAEAAFWARSLIG